MEGFKRKPTENVIKNPNINIYVRFLFSLVRFDRTVLTFRVSTKFYKIIKIKLPLKKVATEKKTPIELLFFMYIY